ncbi:trypsin-like serine peptidase [Microbispora bryophytorum]|uniref:Serine protease n=1 Tax=Microbispora bryophytorum subsp. camponoti TaxID=1677852 RepID=A0ABR8L5B2_9ACTN|nr:hypothetical protein [Microbispora camponoti]MBD3145137.1 hypothetical protein [Microbispora camponoti]
MKRTLALGGVAAGLLASAAIAAPAHADSVPAVNLANTNTAAQQVAAFWYGQAKANLINATPYTVETTVAAKHVSTGGASADTKAGVVGSSGDQKASTGTLKNVNLPKTTGKVFFIGADNEPHWCSATSVQGQYKNLVATAGHCVYDTKSNAATLDKWVFIPGYYEGKTPWGIYVGKTAYTHYDYSVYEDGDRDYAFVTVYNGVLPTEVRGTGHGFYGVYEDYFKASKVKKAIEAKKETGWSDLKIEPLVDLKSPTGKGKLGDRRNFGSQWVQVDQATIDKSVADGELGDKAPETFPAGTGVKVDPSNKGEFEAAYAAAKPKGKAGYTTGDHKNGYAWSADGKTLFLKRNDTTYTKRTFFVNYDVDYKLGGKKLSIALKDVGTLGSNVGGQGLAYNQKIGTGVFEFGYPSGSHPDGNYAFSGKTQKWAYGKTFKAAAPSMKAEELVGIKSSFTGEGSIGSAWLYRYSNAKRLGYLNGVTIAVSDTDGNNRIDTNVSPYFDGETLAVYKTAAANWSGKIV